MQQLPNIGSLGEGVGRGTKGGMHEQYQWGASYIRFYLMYLVNGSPHCL